MTPEELKQRTKAFAVSAIRVVQTLRQDTVTSVLSRQLVRCATSVGANYRSACLAKSTADMIAKLKLCEEEADETIYWSELLVEAGSVKEEEIESLIKEAEELFKIMSASVLTLRRRPPVK